MLNKGHTATHTNQLPVGIPRVDVVNPVCNDEIVAESLNMHNVLGHILPRSSPAQWAVTLYEVRNSPQLFSMTQYSPSLRAFLPILAAVASAHLCRVMRSSTASKTGSMRSNTHIAQYTTVCQMHEHNLEPYFNSNLYSRPWRPFSGSAEHYTPGARLRTACFDGCAREVVTLNNAHSR